MKILEKINYTNDSLWCVYSKEKIEIGDSYFKVTRLYKGEKIILTYKTEYKDFIEEEE
jgi:hypothetical protein